jgi:hypothetical protein
LKLLLTWQEMQGVATCAPVKAKPVVAWLKLAVVQLAVVWQVEQLAIGNEALAAWCGGVVVCCQVVKWQPEFPQSVGAVVSV